MLQPVGDLFKDKTSVLLDEGDIRHFVGRYLQKKLKANTIFCERVNKGQVAVRAGSPLLQQEVYLLEYDLALALKREADYTLKEFKVTQS